MPHALFEQALQLHRQGQLQQAADLYQRIIAAEPGHVDATHHLGLIAHQSGQHELALRLVMQAHNAAPSFVTFGNLGEILRSVGRVDEAVRCFNEALRLNPKHVDAMVNLGRAMENLKRNDDAINAWDRALALNPGRLDVYVPLGMALRRVGSAQRAADTFRRLTQLAPNAVEAYGHLAMTLLELKRVDEAIVAGRRCAELAPQFAEAHETYGMALKTAGRATEAIAEFEKASEIKPTAINLGNLGWSLHAAGRHDEAVVVFERARALQPGMPEIVGALSTIHVARGDFDQALHYAEESVRLDPQSPACRGHRAVARLLKGDLGGGFADYEWRWQIKGFTSPVKKFPQPLWNGTDPSGRVILLHIEQGFGDTFQFVRYATLLAERGARVWVACDAAAKDLIATVPGVERVLQGASPLLKFDLQSPMLSLPHAFKTTLEKVPSRVPYMTAPEASVAKWAARLGVREGQLRVGLCWAGSPGHANDANRSIQLEQLAPLAAVEGVTFYSLQKGPRADQAKTPPAGMTMVSLSDEIRDFSDTAGIIAHLDLVISVDTSIVHLAGALGARVWTLLPFSPDWRWIVGRDNSPWYPTMRLFRQTTARDWDCVIDRVAAALRDYRDGAR